MVAAGGVVAAVRVLIRGRRRRRRRGEGPRSGARFQVRALKGSSEGRDALLSTLKHVHPAPCLPLV